MNGNGGRRQPREIEVVDGDDKAFIWKLPQVKFKEIGKVGPAFGLGFGCGVGLGFGLVGGAGFGSVIPGLQIGFGFGAGCGVGIGFGYAMGRGIAYDQYKKYSNVGKLAGSWHPPDEDPLTGLIDELVINTKKLAKATSAEIDKWRR